MFCWYQKPDRACHGAGACTGNAPGLGVHVQVVDDAEAKKTGTVNTGARSFQIIIF